MMTSTPNGRDVGSKIAIDYGVWGLPETFFIDREGRITYKHVGAAGATLPLLLLRACPLGMFFMMRQMGKTQQQEGGRRDGERR